MDFFEYESSSCVCEVQSSSAHVDHSEPQTLGVNLSSSSSPSIFELRVTNWAYGVQISSVHVAQNASLIKIPDFSRTIEVIGDSLSAGQYATLEGISSYSYGLAAGLGNTEYSITAYPGICLFDKRCYGNLRGMFYQWFRTSDTSGRAIDIWGDEPEVWDFKQRPSADIVVINMGTNDSGPQNNVTTKGFVAQYTMLIQGIHAVWPDAQIILIVRPAYHPHPAPLSHPKLTRRSPSGVASPSTAAHTSKPRSSSPKS